MYLISFFATAKNVDVIVLSQTADYPLMVLLFGKIMNKKIIDFVGGSRIFLSQVILHSKTTLLRKMASIYGMISLRIASRIVWRIVLISDSLTNDNSFNKFKNKIRIAWNFPSSKFYDVFKIRKKFYMRGMVIGYVGKFTLAKGVYNFALAIESITKNTSDLKVIFVGDYQNSEPPYLGLKIKEMFRGRSNVVFIGRVSHEKVAEYLNEMRLLVLPSYSEGLPHVILEAMACGVPVLATPVGAIPDVIKDCETGFLLKSNDPRYIAERIVELLNKPKLLEKVSINSYNFVRENFSYKKTLENWKRIINEL
jgi:glycosyltransferase involved in cell wall biosynthesis